MKRVAGPALTTSDPAKYNASNTLTESLHHCKHRPLRNIGKGKLQFPPAKY
ncbi:hypothetical protein FHT70_001125 [Rhizobium sp. BK049]|nr:hypothetical protein [Rhizobium sp. BK049]